MTSSNLRTALRVGIGILLLVGFGALLMNARPVALPEITMTTGGGFSGSSQMWKIAPDGSWTWGHADRPMQEPQPTRSGRLTEKQRDELIVLATDPLLDMELRAGHSRCTISDGDAEHLDVGSAHYLASWCDEDRPHIQHLRARILSLTYRP